MTGPAFTMLGDADAVACVGDSCAVPGSSASEGPTTAEGRSDERAPAGHAPAEGSPAGPATAEGRSDEQAPVEPAR